MRRTSAITKGSSSPDFRNLLAQLERRRVRPTRLARETLAQANPRPSRSSVHRLVRDLWRSGSAQARQLAVLLLAGFEGELDKRTWKRVEEWIDDVRSDSFTDALAGRVLAPLVARDRSHLRALLGWARSENPWRRRAALETLHNLSLLRDAFIPEILVIARLLACDRERPVEEALGRALHRCAQLAPSTVRQFLLLHRDEIAEVVRRETTRGLPTAAL